MNFGGTSSILTGIFHDFPHSFHSTAEIVSGLGHYRFLSKLIPFQHLSAILLSDAM
jgi:hypothetical protein